MSAEIIIMGKILSLTACEILETYYREKILCSYQMKLILTESEEGRKFIISPNLTLELKSFHPLRIHAHMHTRTHTRTHTHMHMHTHIPEGTRTNTHSCTSVHSLSFECTQPLSFTLSLSHTLYLSFSLKTHTASCSNDTPCFTLPKFQQQPPTPLISHFSVCSLYHEDTEPR